MKYLCVMPLVFVVLSQGAVKVPLRFVSDIEHERLLKSFPPDLQPSPNIVFYNDSVMPPAYQAWEGDLIGFHKMQKAEIGFPWQHTAGLERSPNAGVHKWVVFPEGSEIKWWRQRMEGDTHPVGSLRWMYPAGTMFGENLFVKHQGREFTFEVRTRVLRDDHWTVDVLRPFPERSDLVNALHFEGFGLPDMEFKPTVLKGPGRRGPIAKLTNKQSFDHDLPDMDADLVQKLLNRPYKSALGKVFHEDFETGLKCFAPTSKKDFAIVPRNYQAGYFPVDSKSCMACHDTTMRSWRSLGIDVPGHAPGDHQIMSFHIVEPSSVAPTDDENRAVALRQALVQAGLLKAR